LEGEEQNPIARRLIKNTSSRRRRKKIWEKGNPQRGARKRTTKKKRPPKIAKRINLPKRDLLSVLRGPQSRKNSNDQMQKPHVKEKIGLSEK